MNAVVIPACPPDREEERSRLHRLCSQFPLVMLELSELAPFDELARGPWQLFEAIARYWRPESAEAWPSQETLARTMRVTARSVRLWTSALVDRGFIVLRRETQHNGNERLYYAIGPTTRAALDVFRRKYPRVVSPPPEVVSSPPPEATSMELKIPDPEENFSSRASEQPEEEKLMELVDQEVAKQVLAELEARKHPKRPPVRVFDALKVGMVARCSSAVDGDQAAKLAALRWALAAAWTVSDGPPSVRFVFGELEHFFEHSERGRQRAGALERVHGEQREHVPRDRVGPLVDPSEAHASLERLWSTFPSQNPATGHATKVAENPSMRPPVPVVDKGDA